MSATRTLCAHPTRSVRRTSGLVLVGYTEVIQERGFAVLWAGSPFEGTALPPTGLLARHNFRVDRYPGTTRYACETDTFKALAYR
jgi:hypothetical protein